MSTIVDIRPLKVNTLPINTVPTMLLMIKPKTEFHAILLLTDTLLMFWCG